MDFTTSTWSPCPPSNNNRFIKRTRDMHQLYSVATGPLLYLSFLLFLGGLLIQIVLLVRETYTKERFMFSFLSAKSAILSLSHWISPFGARVMRRNKAFTLVSFGFHLGLVGVPVFLFEHIMLVYEGWGLYWPALPRFLADGASVLVIAACVFFLIRRSRTPDLLFISTPLDFVIPVLVMVPFATGLWASYKLPGFTALHIVHILSGEVLISVIPFTRISHMVFGFFTRVYTSSEFGGTRAAKDW
jgi:nitrate reductase gamma subunit